MRHCAITLVLLILSIIAAKGQNTLPQTYLGCELGVTTLDQALQNLEKLKIDCKANGDNEIGLQNVMVNGLEYASGEMSFSNGVFTLLQLKGMETDMLTAKETQQEIVSRLTALYGPMTQSGSNEVYALRSGNVAMRVACTKNVENDTYSVQVMYAFAGDRQ